MIIKPELMKRIKEHFNLNIYETKVWLALLSKGIATAGEIAEISNVPRSRTYDVLESLEKQGFAILKLGKPVKYIAVSPSVVLERLKTNILKEAEEKAKLLATIKDNEDYKQLLQLHRQGIEPIQPEDLSGMIRGRTNLNNHIKNLILKAKKNVLIVTTASALAKERWIKSVLENLNKKNVKVKIMVNGNEDEIKSLTKDLKAEVKQSNISSRFYIIDNEMIFMLTPDSTNDDYAYGIWINSPYFINTIISLFNNAWKN
ncbi:MAG: helix-turn-helix domain-containing protein [Candidatus Pacearchaeota archaeon]